MLSLQSTAALSFAGAPMRAMPSRAGAPVMETEADLQALAQKLNPTVGYYNPTSLAEMEFWGQSQEATIGWLRQAEIKHGRVAMFAFVGYCVQANGIHFPWDLTTSGISFGDISAAGSPQAQWDALPTNSKLQIVCVIGFFEWWSENSRVLANNGEKHYMRGGKPGYFPPFNGGKGTEGGIPHPTLNYFDPFGLSAKASPEKKAKGLLAEINNGRLAQIGIMAFMAEAKVPGSVPALKGIVTPSSGECMSFFSESDSALPYVKDMLGVSPF